MLETASRFSGPAVSHRRSYVRQPCGQNGGLGARAASPCERLAYVTALRPLESTDGLPIRRDAAGLSLLREQNVVA